jgi:hypothetical protein
MVSVIFLVMFFHGAAKINMGFKIVGLYFLIFNIFSMFLLHSLVIHYFDP